MKFTVSDVTRRAEDRAAEKEAAAKRINSLRGKISELIQQKDTAANAGDVDAFRSINTELVKAEEELEVAQAHYRSLQENAFISKEEAAAAWADYSGSYNQRFDQKYAEFDGLLHKAYKVYQEMVDDQTDAFSMREKLFDYSGLKNNDLGLLDKPYDAAFPCRVLPVMAETFPQLKMGGTMASHPDMVFYIARYAKEHKLSPAELAQQKWLLDILIRHTTRAY